MNMYDVIKAFVRGDYSYAARCLEIAAKGGDVDAQYCLGVCYCYGRGVKQDINAALNWYRKAAEKGHREAQKAYEALDRQVHVAEDASILDAASPINVILSRMNNGESEIQKAPEQKQTAPEPAPITASVAAPDNKKYVYPKLELLSDEDYTEPNDNLLETSVKLVDILSRIIGAPVGVVNKSLGPSYARYEVEIPENIHIGIIERHLPDIADELGVKLPLRFEAPMYGKRTAAIEIPNEIRGLVSLYDLIGSEFLHASEFGEYCFPVGIDGEGKTAHCDLLKAPHLLVCGQSGSGKSIFLNSVIVSLMYRLSPDDLRFILIDPRKVEFNCFNGMPHLLVGEVISDTEAAYNALKWAACEMERRYCTLIQSGCNTAVAYNNLDDVKSGKKAKMPQIVIVIDEIYDLMISPLKHEIEDKIKQLTAKARAAGLHLIISTLQTSSDVLTGTVKGNLSSRIVFRVPSQIDSRLAIDMTGAETLVGPGEMLYYPSDYSMPKRVQGPYVSDRDVAVVVQYLKDNNKCEFDSAAVEAILGSSDGSAVAASDFDAEQEDELFPDVTEFIIKYGTASVSGIQRRFSIGYARSAHIMDRLEELGFVGESTMDGKPRTVYITRDKFKALFGREVDDTQSEPYGAAPTVKADVIKPQGEPAEDELFQSVLEFVTKSRACSMSVIQRKFVIGFSRAARIVQTMEERGYIGKADLSGKPREVFITPEKFKELYGRNIND